MNLGWLDEIGNRQDGLITRQQALMVLTERQIDRFLANRSLIQFHESVYRFAGAPKTWIQSIRAADLCHSGSLLVSHKAAARLHKVWVGDAPVEVIVPYGNYVRLNEVSCHRSRLFDLISTSVVAGIRVTSPARTLVDVAGTCSEKTLRKLVDLMITRQIVTIDEILVELGNSGRRAKGRERLSLLTNTRDALTAQCDTELEAWCLDIMRRNGLPDPVSQFWIDINGKPRRLDFAYPKLRVGIELQSWTYHAGPFKFQDDQERISLLTSMNWNVLLITRSMPEELIVRIIRDTLTRSHFQPR